jgi:hypothetical protein
MNLDNDPIAALVEIQMKQLKSKGVNLEGGSQYNRVFEAFYNLLSTQPLSAPVEAGAGVFTHDDMRDAIYHWMAVERYRTGNISKDEIDAYLQNLTLSTPPTKEAEAGLSAEEVGRIFDAGFKSGFAQGADIEQYTGHKNKDEFIKSYKPVAAMEEYKRQPADLETHLPTAVSEEGIEKLFDDEAELRYPLRTHSDPANSPYGRSNEVFKYGCRFGYKAASTPLLPSVDSCMKEASRIINTAPIEYRENWLMLSYEQLQQLITYCQTAKI